jgi:hypothetical protein
VGRADRQGTDLGTFGGSRAIDPAAYMNHLFYRRHFALLACFSVLIGVIGGLHLAPNIYASFAMYGALHAAALVLALRSRHSIWRRCWFVAAGAALSVLALRVGTLAGQLTGIGPGNINFYWLLGLSAATGAVAYGLSIRLFGFHALTLPALAAIAAACLLATCIGAFSVTHIHFLGPWWLAVIWWYAFSAGLWHFDPRDTRD